MTTVLKVNLKDLNIQFIQNIQQKYGMGTEVEIHLHDESNSDLLSEEQFWEIIDSIDWSKQAAEDKLRPAAERLAAMPISHIFLFADKLSEKLFLLDTKQHASVFLEEDDDLSVDDFLYARCAVVAEGREFYEEVLQTPSLMPEDLIFEPLLRLPDLAFQLKIGTTFNYRPAFNCETYSNKSGWN